MLQYLEKISIRSFILKFLVNCEAGHYRDADTVECQVCAENSISQAGASICSVCAEGSEAKADKTVCGKFISMKGTCYYHIVDGTVISFGKKLSVLT